MSATAPLVTFGMPVRNSQKTLSVALQSIIDQTYRNWELLLLDDGSTDRTLEIARGFGDPRIKIAAFGTSRGLAARLNQTIEATSASLFARMDGDDISYPERLEKQVDYLLSHPKVDLTASSITVIDTNGKLLGKRSVPEEHDEICARPASGFPMPHSVWLGRTAFFRRYMYRSSAVRCEDQDLLLRSYRHARFANVTDIIFAVCEGELRLEKLLKSRRHLALCMVEDFVKEGRPDLALAGACGQALKASVDAVALSTGLRHRLLRHRARPFTSADRDDWERVWRGLQEHLQEREDELRTGTTPLTSLSGADAT